MIDIIIRGKNDHNKSGKNVNKTDECLIEMKKRKWKKGVSSDHNNNSNNNKHTSKQTNKLSKLNMIPCNYMSKAF